MSFRRRQLTTDERVTDEHRRERRQQRSTQTMDGRRRIFSCRPTTESTKARWYRRGLKWVSGGSVPRRIRIVESKVQGGTVQALPRQTNCDQSAAGWLQHPNVRVQNCRIPSFCWSENQDPAQNRRSYHRRRPHVRYPSGVRQVGRQTEPVQSSGVHPRGGDSLSHLYMNPPHKPLNTTRKLT
ncbi:hypothetical protein J8273_2979 [Carpediemonas membranifera]|uniref:Uncharacterized protein n=1 Tax=Carpediemonas membranifera TaxID=201153 RepID=A0A8J6BDU4_9EUKA|nr:hypothetical protein J8273_2979 [Carpediemonas membranifera]|eukprot:KAG9395412.1 hypothetical protein J8273_2979 [Carpediemonas membranifera]